MGNVWGTANPLLVGVLGVNAGDLACNAGVQTGVIVSANLIAQAPGNYYPMLWGNVAILLGATPPTALTYGFNLNGGSAVDTQTVPPGLLIANATLNLPIALVGVASPTNWIGAGSLVALQIMPTAQAVTYKGVGSRILLALFRGADA